MTESQSRFFALIEEFPRIAVHWDRNSCSLDLEGFEEELDQLSPGEAAIARFFAAVWLGENQYGFDIVKHLPDCDDCARAIISAWTANPFFP